MSIPTSNDGIFVLRPPEEAGGRAFYLVLGSPRGGTTLVAHTLAKLGVSMGEKLPFTVEDQHLAAMAEARAFGDITKRLAHRSARWKRHGWKLPQLLYYCENWDFLPEHTRLIFTYRDPVATAVRGHMATDHDFENELHTVFEYHRRMFELARETHFPAVFISYEKALLKPETFVKKLGEYIGIEDKECIDRAIRFIQPSPDVYQKRDSEKKRNALRKHLVGCIDYLEEEFISGWAFNRSQPGKPVEVEFQFESGLCVSAVADRMRQDMVESGRHPTGRCGYRINFSKGHSLTPGETVYAREKGSGAEFEGSPFVYTTSIE